MRDIFVISDTHFGHSNVLKFEDDDGNLIRGAHFDSIEEHDEAIIDNWNAVVGHQDIIYHLGDVFMGPKDEFITKFKRLKGRKRLVLGNQDDAKFFIKNELISKVVMWRMFREEGLLLTHVPVHNSTLGEGRFGGKPMINIHGHIHQNASPTDRHKCVCVEHTNYAPVNIEDLVKENE